MRLSCTVFSAVSFLLFSSAALAQSITITGPSSNVAVKEGDDYATTQLHNPWDFAQRRDIGWEENFSGSSVKVSNGVWSGTNAITGGFLFPLFPGFKGALAAEGLDGDTSLPNLGINHPIDASRYYYLSYRLKHSQRSSFAIYWNNDSSAPQYWPDGSMRAASYDGYYTESAGHGNSGWVDYNFNLHSLNSFDQSSGSWTGNVIALRLDPSTGGGVGTTTDIDWIRLVDPNSAPTLDITWSSSGVNTSSNPDADVITVWADTNNSGFDGSPLKRYTRGQNPGTYSLPTAILPPGTYYFYLTITNGTNGSLKARSGYSAKLTIDAAPNLQFNSPSQITGEDYSTTVVDDPWDMTSATDVANLDTNTWPDQWRQFSSPTFTQEGTFSAIADVPLAGNTETDAQIHLNVPSNKPIDTSRYRYLTYRMWIDGTNFPTMPDKVSGGWVARPVFWNSDVILDAGRASAHVVYEGWHTYTIDLWNSSLVELGKSWQTFGFIRHLRIDPLETAIPTEFQLDWATLTAPNHTSDGTYDISYTLSDSDDSTFTVSLYYDTNATGFNGTLIETLNGVTAGSHTYTWDTSGLTEGNSYYVYAVVSDGVNTSKFYTPVSITVGDISEPVSPSDRAPRYDYDGDGKSDYVVYRKSSAYYFVNSSSSGVLAQNWGGSTFTPVEGDYDGDGKSDYAVVTTVDGYYYWYVILSSTGGLYYRQWGIAGDQFVVNDYNGDGKDEIAVYRQGAWYILYDTGNVGVSFWGLPGDVPVPGDYDGDGSADVAIWRPSDGMWWILYSGWATGDAPNYYAAEQWGLPGDIPLVGNFRGDHRADLTVWRPGLGMWFTREVGSDPTSDFEMMQWGLYGDIPIVGDFNGDGITDFTVFRPGPALWIPNFRDGNFAVVQWGLDSSLDMLPQ